MSDNDGGGGYNSRLSPPLCYGDVFEDQCGYYISIGMSYHDYWDGDCTMVRYYRHADELKKKRENFNLWLQASYIYEAILDASPVVNPLSKRNKPYPFRSEPIPIRGSKNITTVKCDNKKKMENGKKAMLAMAEIFNKRFRDNQAKEVNPENGNRA